MKKRGLLFASVLVIGMGMSLPVPAEEASAQSGGGIGGFLDSLLSEGTGAVESLLGEDGADSSLLGDKGISGLFEEDGALAGILPEGIDVKGVLESVGSELEDVNSTLHQELQSVAEMVTNEDGSVDWEKVGGSVEELLSVLKDGGILDEAGGEADEGKSDEDIDALLAELMIPYEKADAVMFDYIAERNADLMDAGDVQIFSKRSGYMGDPEEDEFKALADFTQVNFTVDGDQMNMVSAATDTLLLTLTKGEDGSYTVTDEKYTEDGEAYAASLEALCAEVDISVDDFYASTVLGAYNDADALAEYLREHPEIATAEYQGEQMTAEELEKMSDEYSDELFDSIFGEEEEVTEAVAE